MREKTVDAFRKDAVCSFEERMIEHLRRFSPPHFRILDQEQVRDVIQHGTQRAQHHGFTSERSIRYYVDVMFMLGSGFDDDPLLPWARNALAEGREEHESVRIDRLNGLAWDHVKHIRPDLVRKKKQGSSVFVEEIQALRGESNERLVPFDREPLATDALEWLVKLFPRKTGRLDETRLRSFVDGTMADAESIGLGTRRGALMLMAMRLVLGSGCTEDPLLPWLPPRLQDPTISSTPERVTRVFAALVACLQRWWQ